MIQARRRRTPTRETNKAVLVAMENTPTLSRLAFANQELEAVKDVSSPVQVLPFCRSRMYRPPRSAEELSVSRRCRDKSTAGRWSTGFESKGSATFFSVSISLWNWPYSTGAIYG
ncbi:hypothetical protein LB505_003963 [Fusarium chuoi]|nr:hypothetical protein LB505_003963 [Fusarium chuoi]